MLRAIQTQMEAMMPESRIVSDPDILCGKPVINGTRVSVELILRMMGSSVSTEEMLEAYPFLTRDDILAAYNYAADRLTVRSESVAAE